MRISILLALAGCGVSMLAAGCGGSPVAAYPVTGTVQFADGSPLPGGWVEFELVGGGGERISARGPIGDDGSFRLQTMGAYDGAAEGEHRVLIVAPLPNVELRDAANQRYEIIHEKYRSFDTSELRATVTTDAKKNHFVFTVERP